MAKGDAATLRLEQGELRALVATKPVLADAATATIPEVPSPSETAQTLAALQADFKRYKDKFAVHEAKAANLSKRCDVEFRALHERMMRLYMDVAPVAARVAAMKADFEAVHARAAEAFGNQEAALSILVCSLPLPAGSCQGHADCRLDPRWENLAFSMTIMQSKMERGWCGACSLAGPRVCHGSVLCKHAKSFKMGTKSLKRLRAV